MNRHRCVTTLIATVAAALFTAVAGCGGDPQQPGSDGSASPDLRRGDGCASCAPDLALPSGSDGGIPPVLGACPVFPVDNPWNRDISNDPIDPLSDQYMAGMNAATHQLHPDFGSDPSFGIPWITVAGSQAKVPMTFQYPAESDPGPYPFPPNAPVEGGPNAVGDRHVIAIDTDACVLYETFDSHFLNPGWMCGSGARFDLRSNALRPDGWTSADAAGLPIFPGLARRDEAIAGAIRHALRFTVVKTQNAYVHPATHLASNDASPMLPPMGLRVRLKASYDVSTFTGNAKVILVGLQRYGMFVADNGSDWYISGETNPSWDDADVGQLKSVPATAFEVVKLGAIMR